MPEVGAVRSLHLGRDRRALWLTLTSRPKHASALQRLSRGLPRPATRAFDAIPRHIKGFDLIYSQPTTLRDKGTRFSRMFTVYRAVVFVGFWRPAKNDPFYRTHHGGRLCV
jgi:hypothetical protein